MCPLVKEKALTRRYCKCKTTKPLDTFIRNKYNKCGYGYVCRECTKATSATYRYAGYYREWKISTKYGLTLLEYEEIMAKGCALCGTYNNLCLDHCHATGNVRKALCQTCNRRLGHVEHDRVWTFKALTYLGW